MHGPGLFLMILRKGLGLFFERAIPKSARCPKSTDFLEKLGFPSSMDAIAWPEAIPKASRRNRHKKSDPTRSRSKLIKKSG